MRDRKESPGPQGPEQEPACGNRPEPLAARGSKTDQRVEERSSEHSRNRPRERGLGRSLCLQRNPRWLQRKRVEPLDRQAANGVWWSAAPTRNEVLGQRPNRLPPRYEVLRDGEIQLGRAMKQALQVQRLSGNLTGRPPYGASYTGKPDMRGRFLRGSPLSFIPGFCRVGLCCLPEGIPS
jgi:hypothetical protein